MTPRIEAKDWETIADPASRQQLFMMFVKGELKELKERERVSVYKLTQEAEKTIVALSTRIWVLENKIFPKKKAEAPKVTKEQPWWLQLITKKYK